MKHKNIIIFSFLSIGTILSSFIAYYGWKDIYMLLNYPERAFMYDTGLIILYANCTLLGISGAISLFSYIKKGRLWVCMVKCILINILLLLAWSLVILLTRGLCIGCLITAPVILGCMFGVCKLWELIDPYIYKVDKYIRYLRCINLYEYLTLGFKKQIVCKRLFKILNRLSIDVDRSVGIEFPDEEALGDTSKIYLFSKSDPENRIYHFKDILKVDNSELGAWHFYLLESSKHYLPLWDHANYMARTFITSKTWKIVNRHKYSGSDGLEPTVSFTKISEVSSESLVSACYWSDWGGLFRETFRVVITDNHVTTFEQINDECLLEYNCGIMF